MNRDKIVTVGFCLVTLSIITRLFYINNNEHVFLSQKFKNRIEKKIILYAHRGQILDRNQMPLAVSSPTLSIWTNNKIILNNLNNENNKEKIIQINDLLNINLLDLINKKPNSTYFFIKRKINPSLQNKIEMINLEGLNVFYEDKRFYPYMNISSHVIGFTNVDDNGISGLEYSLNETLKGYNGVKFIELTPKGVMGEYQPQILQKDGNNVNISIDINIQTKVYNALSISYKTTKAKDISAVVLDAKTGEVISLVNYPNYNPNIKSDIVRSNITVNKAIVNVYDPGSIMKPLVIAKAINDKIVNKNTIFDTSQLTVGKKKIKDDHFSQKLSVNDIITQSSDIGTAKIALKYQPKELWDYYKSIGFGQKLNVGFPNETNGLLLNYKKWTTVDQALMSFGYGISVSLLQMAHSYLIFTNNGCINNVSFIKLNKKPICQQIISPTTANIMKEILFNTVENGTGKSAKVDGVSVAGKTGTAQKFINGKYYNTKHISSFVGFFPVDKPKYIIAVMVDEPQNGYYAAATAAPAFSNIVKSINGK